MQYFKSNIHVSMQAYYFYSIEDVKDNQKITMFFYRTDQFKP